MMTDTMNFPWKNEPKQGNLQYKEKHIYKVLLRVKPEKFHIINYKQKLLMIIHKEKSLPEGLFQPVCSCMYQFLTFQFK